jgi:hypothetical protein
MAYWQKEVPETRDINITANAEAVKYQTTLYSIVWYINCSR